VAWSKDMHVWGDLLTGGFRNAWWKVLAKGLNERAKSKGDMSR
jgi:hypothetical protein